eukprot:9384974-Prorocentrum_lima.AAC.1
MTSSLVGSEMCIRDSSSSSSSKYASSSSPPPDGPRCGRTALAVSSTPVSYTHLTLPTICSV